MKKAAPAIKLTPVVRKVTISVNQKEKNRRNGRGLGLQKDKGIAMEVKNLSAKEMYDKALKLVKEEIPDYAGAAELLISSAKEKYAPSIYAIGTWYLNGFFFKKNIKTGTKYIKEAAKMGNSDACFDLAVSYEKGIGLSVNKEKAFQLYLESYFRGDDDAKLEISRCFWFGIGTKANRGLADAASEYFKIKEYRQEK